MRTRGSTLIGQKTRLIDRPYTSKKTSGRGLQSAFRISSRLSPSLLR